MGAMDVNPTRMELIKIKDRIKLAQKGHKLLKQKRDALILEFFKIMKKAQDLRGQLGEKMDKGYQSLALAEIYHNIQELSKVSLDLRKDIEVDVEVRNVMGVKIPNITTSQLDKVHFMDIPTYSVAATSAKIDTAVEDFTDILEMVIKLAETETAMKRLILEIEKTKRRVNALEFVVLPQLTETQKMITFRLEEMERDSFVSLKAIKRRLDKEKQAAREAA